jgi:ribosomal protein S18 acetylase RimI-like enzyme
LAHATVATLDDEIVGVAVLVGDLLDLIWVKPAARSNGIGSALMEEAERRAPIESGELTLEVWKVNRRAVDFYKRLGFSVSGTTEDPDRSREARHAAEYEADKLG